jgi:hypothetical protein
MKNEPQNGRDAPLILVCAMWAMGVVTLFVGAILISAGVAGDWKVIRNENGRIQDCPAMQGVWGVFLFTVGVVIVGVGIRQRRRPKSIVDAKEEPPTTDPK